jgi:hypothetical protein
LEPTVKTACSAQLLLQVVAVAAILGLMAVLGVLVAAAADGPPQELAAVGLLQQVKATQAATFQ